MSQFSSDGPPLEERIRALELQVDGLRGTRRWRIDAPRPIRRALAIIALVATVGVLPMVVLASDTFTDVPVTNTFHANINNLYDAGIANGCATSPTLRYCPLNAVTRAQMAGFLNRGLGRAATSQNSVGFTTDNQDIIVSDVTIDSGGVPGGTGFVVVTGSASAYTDSSTTCPCEIGIRVVDDASGSAPSLWQFFDVSNTASPTGFRNASGSISWVFEVPSGSPRLFTVQADVNMTGATGDLTIQSHISALYVPFGSTGGSTLGSQATPAGADGRAGN